MGIWGAEIGWVSSIINWEGSDLDLAADGLGVFFERCY
jgi:hypothetical protein